MSLYQIVGFSANKSNFVRIGSTGNDEAIFASKVSPIPVTGGRVNMVAGSVTVNTPKEVVPSSGAVVSQVNNSLKITFNVIKGDTAALAALREEANRLLDSALADYNLNSGLVPTASATFPV